ncbi:MAG: flagellar hook assembly protein FlgD [Spirochaetaceae bacterium]|nr:MAG: flagellar hook assembly protein FlgD [Spirochaetaceae bacterium]
MDVGMMSAADRARLGAQVEAFNRTVNDGKEKTQALGKDDFLKILITQLQNQDPMSPMEDREFIAQMAQFSTLEQMTNMGNQFARLSSLLTAGQAIGLLGREVEVAGAAGVTTGIVSEVTNGEYPQVLVNNTYFDVQDVTRVRQ